MPSLKSLRGARPPAGRSPCNSSLLDHLNIVLQEDGVVVRVRRMERLRHGRYQSSPLDAVVNCLRSVRPINALSTTSHKNKITARFKAQDDRRQMLARSRASQYYYRWTVPGVLSSSLCRASNSSLTKSRRHFPVGSNLRANKNTVLFY